jgi:hypothetical protein
MQIKPEFLRRWRKGKFTLSLYDTHKRNDWGKSILSYKFFCNKELVFSGSDYCCSPLHAIDSIESIYGLLGFLSCRPGDIDQEYFDNYTPNQLQFANSFACEELQMLIDDFENGDE